MDIREKEFCKLLESRGFDELIIEGIATGKFRLIAKTGGKLVYFRDLKGQIKTYNKIEQVAEWLQRRFQISKITLDIFYWNSGSN